MASYPRWSRALSVLAPWIAAWASVNDAGVAELVSLVAALLAVARNSRAFCASPLASSLRQPRSALVLVVTAESLLCAAYFFLARYVLRQP